MKKGYIYIAFATILFSTMEIALKLVGDGFNPVQITLSRFFIGGLVLLPFALKKLKEKELRINLNELKQFALLGLLCVVVSMTFYQLAVVNTKASVVAVLFSCNPVFITILAYIILKEQIYKHNIISLVLEIIGIIIIINPLNTKISISGVTLTLLAAITFGFYSVLGKKLCSKYGGIVVTCVSFILGSIQMFILTLVGRINFIAEILQKNNLSVFANVPIFTGYTLENIFFIIYIYIFVTGVGYVMYFKAMEETSANTTSLVFFFKPVLSSILAFVILNENIPSNMIVGIFFIILGSIESILPPLLQERKKNTLVS